MEHKLDNLEFGVLFLFAFIDFGFEPWLDITVKVLVGIGSIYKIITMVRRHKYDKQEQAMKMEKHALEMRILRKQLGENDKDEPLPEA